MKQKDFKRLTEMLGNLSPTQLRNVSQRVDELNGKREVQDLTNKRVASLAGCALCGHPEFAR